jgi:hypothetical protein
MRDGTPSHVCMLVLIHCKSPANVWKELAANCHLPPATCRTKQRTNKQNKNNRNIKKTLGAASFYVGLSFTSAFSSSSPSDRRPINHNPSWRTTRVFHQTLLVFFWTCSRLGRTQISPLYLTERRFTFIKPLFVPNLLSWRLHLTGTSRFVFMPSYVEND